MEAHHTRTLPTTLKRAKFHFGATVDQLAMAMDQSKPLPNLIKPLSYDPFSSALRLFSQHLTHLDLRICTDSTLFWPSSSESAAGPPSWPHLQHLHVELHPASPSGRWYFADPRGAEGRNDATGYKLTKPDHYYPPVSENETDEEWDETWNLEGGRAENMAPDMFRIVPVDQMVEGLLGAFARALACMPVLEEAELFTVLSWRPGEGREEEGGCLGDNDPPPPPFDPDSKMKYRWGVRYLAGCGGPSAGGGRLEWQVGDWRPGEALRQLFHSTTSVAAEEQFMLIGRWL
jgi:hypothetical protein